jgi:hypothetical protein
MKRHVAATLLGVLGFLIIDSHFDWVRHDNGTLLEVNGQQFDPKGWMAEHWRQLHQDCRPVHNDIATPATTTAVLHTIQQHSLPDSLEARLLQLHRHDDWAIAEVEFKTLNPSIVVLRQTHGDWKIQENAVWSGSTAPWLAADFVRRYLRQQAPDLPQALLHCVPIEGSRYAATASRTWL